jgi:hypothetical protein
VGGFSLNFFIYINLILKELKISSFPLGKFFGKVENGQNKCPKIEKAKTVLRKYMFLLHN